MSLRAHFAKQSPVKERKLLDKIRPFNWRLLRRNKRSSQRHDSKEGGMKNEYHFHINGNADRIRDALNLLDGVIQTMTAQSDGDIQITWKPNPKANPLEKITSLLQNGKRDN